ncbi:hypothetical protein [Paenimyroides baculatum]|uniref:TonB protein C-terminal n=1 Tax=Paenimyroides baculatum TaxID=2608000 RepID=A0A5M6CTC2_9FLAO|nr:hypothetical protein [Paenimyroides baculatum]KAA5538253.1 hypothetical protein F0460_01225 [Paenimyroides baculatum]
MKTKIAYLLFVLFSVTLNAQTAAPEKKVTVREIPVYRDVDVMATYRGGYAVILKQIEDATKNCKRGSFKGKDTTVIIDILITDKGKVAKVEFVKAEVTLCNDDIQKAIEKATQWIPGRIDNKPVNSYLQLTVNLTRGNNSDNNVIRRLN